MLFSRAEPLDLGSACRPNRSLAPRLSGILASLLAPSAPTGLIVALILTASLASEPTAALILTGGDREATDHHQRDWEDSPHAMLDDREGPSHAMLKVWECHSDSGAFWRFRRANIRVHGRLGHCAPSGRDARAGSAEPRAPELLQVRARYGIASIGLYEERLGYRENPFIV